MFAQPRAARRKGMLGPEVGEHPLEPPGLAPRADLDARREGPQIAALRIAPQPFFDADFPKDAPPTQGFFFLTVALGLAL